MAQLRLPRQLSRSRDRISQDQDQRRQDRRRGERLSQGQVADLQVATEWTSRGRRPASGASRGSSSRQESRAGKSTNRGYQPVQLPARGNGRPPLSRAQEDHPPISAQDRGRQAGGAGLRRQNRRSHGDPAHRRRRHQDVPGRCHSRGRLHDACIPRTRPSRPDLPPQR